MYPDYHILTESQQIEIDNSVQRASAGLLLRLWEEVSKLFLDFLTTSTNSPYKNVKATFSRREYQSNSGNLAHAHIILAVNWLKLTEEQKVFVENLAKCSIFDVVKSNDIGNYLERGIILHQRQTKRKRSCGLSRMSIPCYRMMNVPLSS